MRSARRSLPSSTGFRRPAAPDSNGSAINPGENRGPHSATTLHTATTAPARRLHSRRLAWSRRGSIPARAGRVLANDQEAQEMRLTKRAWIATAMAAVTGGAGRNTAGGHGMKWLLALGVSALAVFWLSASQASASTLTDCLAQKHVCVAGDGRGLVSEGQQAQLEQQIGGDRSEERRV